MSNIWTVIFFSESSSKKSNFPQIAIFGRSGFRLRVSFQMEIPIQFDKQIEAKILSFLPEVFYFIWQKVKVYKDNGRI